MYVFTAIILLTGIIIIYFLIPFSPVKNEFNKMLSAQIQKESKSTDVFTLHDIEKLPKPVKKYFEYCKLTGKRKMTYSKIIFKNAAFLMSPGKPYTKIDFTECYFVREPVRIVFIDTKMFGIPFQGIDSYINGKGGMKGVFAKAITLFNQTGPEMDIGCLVTVLSACLVSPNIALQDYIVWEEIDDRKAKATISYYGISASGIFNFAETGEMTSFTTNDRWEIEPNGKKRQIPWSLKPCDYAEKDGIMQASRFRVMWHYGNEESVYFDGKNTIIEHFR